MPKEIYGCQVFDCLKKYKEVRFVDYENHQILDITDFAVSTIQKLIDYADEQNDAKTYFYIMED